MLTLRTELQTEQLALQTERRKVEELQRTLDSMAQQSDSSSQDEVELVLEGQAKLNEAYNTIKYNTTRGHWAISKWSNWREKCKV